MKLVSVFLMTALSVTVTALQLNSVAFRTGESEAPPSESQYSSWRKESRDMPYASGTAAAACKGMNKCAINLVILLDGSASVTNDNFNISKLFVQMVVQNLYNGWSANGQQLTKFGFILFAATVEHVFPLENNLTQSELEARITGAKYPNGRFTRTHRGIKAAREMFLHPVPVSASSSANVILLITDGKSTEKSETIREAAETRSAGISILAVGVGSAIDINELELIAGNMKHVFNQSSFTSLDQIVCPINEMACAIPPQQPPEPINPPPAPAHTVECPFHEFHQLLHHKKGILKVKHMYMYEILWIVVKSWLANFLSPFAYIG